MSSTQITKELFEVLRKRNYGDPKKDSLRDPRLGDFEQLRNAGMWTGEIFQPQLDTLKRTAMLILNGAVVITIDQNNLTIHFVGPTPESTSNQTKLEALTYNVLGPGWTVTHESSTPDKSRKPAKQRRTRRTKKGRR